MRALLVIKKNLALTDETVQPSSGISTFALPYSDLIGFGCQWYLLKLTIGASRYASLFYIRIMFVKVLDLTE